MSNIKNIPKNIYLQVDGGGDNSEIDFKELVGITWCVDKVNETDLKYQLNQTSNRLFTKDDLIAFALYVPNFKSAEDKRKYLEDNFEVWALIRK
jgi:hypothetical protein